jgi:hypothetical protein
VDEDAVNWGRADGLEQLGGDDREVDQLLELSLLGIEAADVGLAQRSLG